MSKKSKMIQAALDAQKQGYAVDENALMQQLNGSKLAVPYTRQSQGFNDPNVGYVPNQQDLSTYQQSLAVPAEAAPPPVYSQPVQDFINQMMAYEREQDAKGYVLNLKDPTIKAGMAEGDWQKLIDSKASVPELYALGHEFKTNKGNAAGTVFASPETQYRLRNEKGHDYIVAEGTGLEALDNIYREATNLSTTQRKKANWDVEMMNPETGQWELVAHDDPKKPIGKTLIKIAAIAAPIAGALLIPGLGLGIGAALTGALGSAGAAGVGAAIGTAGVGILQGKSIGKIAKSALISGVTTAATAGLLGGTFGQVGKTVTGALGSIGGSTAGAAAGSGLSAGLGSALDEIVITGSRLGVPALIGSAALGGLTGSAASGGLGSQQPPNTLQNATNRPFDLNTIPKTPPLSLPTTPPFDPTEIFINAPTGALGTGAAATAGAAGALSDLGPDGVPNTGDEEIVINAPTKLSPPVALASGAAGALPDAVPKPDDPIVIEHAPLENVTPHEGVPGLPTDLLPDNFFDDPTTTDPAKKPSTLKTISELLRLAGLATGIGGAALGSKGSSTQGKIPPGFFGSGPNDAIFHAQLPGANLPGVAAGTTQTARQMPQQDWYKYGFRPEQSFFTGVPQTYMPPPMGVEDLWDQQMRAFRGFARGGEVDAEQGALAVRGPGTGTSDDIPAYLSDGEYVFDAATVRAAGGGSTERGFRVLDDLRVKIHNKQAPRSLGVM